MLIISNGAFKSGSSWLYEILSHLAVFSPLPEIYKHKGWIRPSIHPGKLSQCLENLDYENKHYLVKNHFKKQSQRDSILAFDNIYVVTIHRDIRDIVVSAYYHDIRLQRFIGDFSKYYWVRGRRVANGIKMYREVWNVLSDHVYESSYRRLKLDFNAEVSKICEFLDLNITEDRIDEIKTLTAFPQPRKHELDSAKNSGPKFQRKGIVGDWQNHFDQKMLRDISRIEKDGLGVFEWAYLKILSFPREMAANIKKYSSR